MENKLQFFTDEELVDELKSRCELLAIVLRREMAKDLVQVAVNYKGDSIHILGLLEYAKNKISEGVLLK